jgi:hypothetical protein
MRRFGWLVLALTAACGSGSSGSNGPSQVDGVTLMPGFDPGPAPAAGAGFQVVLPIVKNIAVGGSYEWCSWTNVILDRDAWVKESIGHQTESGHHVIVYYTMNPVQGGQSRICNDSDMATFRFALGAAGEGVAQDQKLPGDLAVHIPKGAQIIVNHHYLNASAQPIEQAQSAVTVLYSPPGAPVTESSSLAVTDSGMTVAPGMNSVDTTCTMNQDYAAWSLLPHAHNWATHVTVDHVTSSTTERLFDVAWNPSYAFHPPAKTLDPSQPYLLRKGDQIHIHCDYDNTSSGTLVFGQEMCVMYGETVDSARVGNVVCDQANWGSF